MFTDLYSRPKKFKKLLKKHEPFEICGYIVFVADVDWTITVALLKKDRQI
jgi:hypothetical protein